ncbi:DUF7569 family protein [Salinigranum halophilum]|jgi:hypothetical protein|uniref:DUF7569 family protein n=1 Tax=Salinigranum halophilum TaxID=2565931 RepID=UPI0010A7B863|nr:hypothetical protein [Salinigranum halophilum]
MYDAPDERDHRRPDGGHPDAPCDDCGTSVADALTRTVEVTVDGDEIHSHRLCPDCFAAWVDRYERQMSPGGTSEDSEIIVD